MTSERPLRVGGGMLVLTVLLLAGALGAELLLVRPLPPAPDPVPVSPPMAGAWYCPVTASEGDAATLSVAAAGEEPSEVTVVRWTEEGVVTDAPVGVTPGDELTILLEGEAALQPVGVRWTGGPAAALWRVDGEHTAAAPCEPAPSSRWYVAGFDTTLGSRSRLHLFNPFGVDAVARVTFATPEGPVALLLTDNVAVPAGGTHVLDLNEFQPEEPDLGVVVEVLAGRLVVAGELVVAPPDERPAVRGRTILPAARAPSETWAYAFARVDEGSGSWLSVLNPADREAAIEVRVSAPRPDSPVLLTEYSVPAGGLLRLDLAEASEEAEFGVLVTGLNAVPVVVTRVTAIRTGGGRMGLAGTLGATEAAGEWAVVGGGTGERASRVSLYNPGPEGATIDVIAPDAPAEWSGIELGPNERTSIELEDLARRREGIPVLIRASGPVVAELRSLHREGTLRLWTALGVPARAWLGPATRPPVMRDRPMITRPLVEEPPTPTG